MPLLQTDTPLIALDGVSFAYPGGRELFQNLSLELRRGEHLGLYGPNGSGKTTLFRLLTGLEIPGQGRVLLEGLQVQGEKDWLALRRKVGFLLQNAEDQLFYPSVLDDVAFGPLNLGWGVEKSRAEALRVLRDLGLEGFESRLIHKLSGGEKRLAALAGVLAMRPEALLLDEPVNGLDPEAEERILLALRDIPAARIIISHDQALLRKTSSCLLRLENGKLTSM